MRISKLQVFSFMIAFLFLFISLRLFQLQVLEGSKYQKLAEENAAKTVPVVAPRGIIFDRNGRALVENKPVFFVQIMPYLFPKDQQEKEEVLRLLGKLLGEKIEVKVSATQPVVIKDNVSLQKAIMFEEYKDLLPGVVLGSRPFRFYSFGRACAHLLGYVGEIEQEELNRLKDLGYRLGNIIGKDGIEKFYDREIRGIDGGQKIEVDVRGQPTRMLESFDPIPGANVRLTIDIDLQLAAEKALGNREGAVVILDPRTGGILALVSHPNYDPNKVWEALKYGKHPFMNRALSGYPPGSIFKVVTFVAALEEKITTPQEIFYCPGYYLINNRVAKCWKEGGHGRIDIKEGLVWSCDVVFYELGRRLGPDRLAKYAKIFGLGDKLGIDLPQERKGLIPTKKWKNETFREPWYEGDSINYGIGQGFVQVTPLQMAMVYGAIATGYRVKPFVVSEIKDYRGKMIYQAEPQKLGDLPFSQQTLNLLREALGEVVERGTGIAVKVAETPAAGKTGTAQNPGLPHAWFLCYAPKDNPEIVIASFVAHGGHGDRVSAYITRDILKFYFDRKKSI